ncbi:MAG: T9SS type A sorting domain-containing protein [Flavobacteriales bacterium]
MKKILLAAGSIALSISMFSQTIVFEDNFDSYTAGLGVAEQSSSWNTWDGSAGLDGEVSTDFAFSGANSAKISGTSTDLVLPVGPYTSGKYDLKFKMMLSDAGGYFNLLHQWAADQTTYQWACDVFFDGSGTVTWTTGGTEGGDATVNLNEWFDVQVTADMDADQGGIYIAGVLVNQWQWSLNNANGMAGINEFVAVDFYGTNTANGSGLYYVDDVQLIESTGINIENTEANFSPALFPNPAYDMLNIVLPADQSNSTINIYDVAGKLVKSEFVAQAGLIQLSVDALQGGVYAIVIENKNGRFATELIVE